MSSTANGETTFDFSALRIAAGIGQTTDSGPDAPRPGLARPQRSPAWDERVRLGAATALLRIQTMLPPRRAAIVLGVCAVLGVGVVGAAVVGRERRVAERSARVGLPGESLPLTMASALPVAVGVPTVSPTTPPTISPTVSPSPPQPAPVQGASVSPTIVVHAAGAVVAPGVYRLADPSRVDDVIAFAGGLSADADQDAINRAARVGDGERIYVPHKGQTPPNVVVGGSSSFQAAANGPNSSTGGSTASTDRVLDVNTATVDQFDTLPGVGPAIASRIVEARTRLGRFRAINQLLDVPGIGEAKLASLRSKVRV